MGESEWTFDVRQCLEASGELFPPERIPLRVLLDLRRLLRVQRHLSEITQMEASVYLYDEASPAPLFPDLPPMLVRSPLCAELNRLQEADRQIPRCQADTWRASLHAMREGRPIAADCVGGRQTLWSCPILLHCEGRSYPKAAITVAAFPIGNFFACEVLEALFPHGNPSLRESRQRAEERALTEERLDIVREFVAFVAEAFSQEISLRYEMARQSLALSRPAAEKVSALVERISQIAHEINNRLTSIHLHAHLAHQWVRSPEAQESLELIKTEARAAIEAVRAWAKDVRQDAAPARADTDFPRAAGPGEPKRILVVDDEKPVAELIARALRAAHYDVDVTLEGQEAIALIERKHYDLIIADLRMPGIGGMELYDHFWRIDPAVARRMVFLTGDVLSASALDFLRQTRSLHLPKPCTLEELLALVRAGLERSESAPSSPEAP